MTKILSCAVALLFCFSSWAQIDYNREVTRSEYYKKAVETLDHDKTYIVLVSHSDDMNEMFKQKHIDSSFLRLKERELIVVDSRDELQDAFKVVENCSAYAFNISSNYSMCLDDETQDSSVDNLARAVDLREVDSNKIKLSLESSRRLMSKVMFLNDVKLLDDKDLILNNGIYAVVDASKASLDDLKVVRHNLHGNEHGLMMFRNENEISRSKLPTIKDCSITLFRKSNDSKVCIDDVKKKYQLDNIVMTYIFINMRKIQK